MVRKFGITIGAMLALPLALGALVLGLVTPVLDRASDDAPGDQGAAVPGSPGDDNDEPATKGPSTTPAEPGSAPARRGTGPARPAPTEPAAPARPATSTPADRARSGGTPSSGTAPAPSAGPPPTATSDPPAQRTPPRPATNPPPPPASITTPRQLRFLSSADPLLCDASDRTAGTLRGAMPGETLRLTSPELHQPIVLTAGSDGSATVTWSCGPDAAGTADVTARSADGRRETSFPVTGVSEHGAPSVARIEAQSRVDAAAGVVLDAVDDAPDTAAGEGFAGVVVSPDRGEVDVHWKGVPPPAVTDAIDRAAAVTGIRVAVRPARLTRHHLLDRAQALVSDDPTPIPPAAALLADRIHRVAVVPEGSGLEVGIAHPAGLDADGLVRWSRRAQRTLEAALRVPVHLVDDAPPTQFDREADSSPWLGGAGIVGDGRCSSGFGVRRFRPGSSTQFGLLTAAHCRGDGQGEFRNGDRTQVIGPDDRRGDLQLDSRLIPVDEAGARVYSGGVDGTVEFTRPVRRPGRNVKGGEVCTSGAATGARCDLVIVNVDTFYRPAGSSSYSHVVEAISRRHRGSLARLGLDDAGPGSSVTIMPENPVVDHGHDVAAGRGDSGGPVFTLTDDGGVEARGTIAGGSRTVACGRQHVGACTANVFFVDIERALDHHHAELVTTNARA